MAGKLSQAHRHTGTQAHRHTGTQVCTGSKIRRFREQAGLSQADLAGEIGNDAAWISRIENNIIQPSFGTIQKISEALSLNSIQALYLLDFSPEEVERSFTISREFRYSLDVDEICQASVNAAASHLDLLAAVIFLTRGDSLVSVTFTNAWFSKPLRALLSRPFNKYSVSLKHHGDNLLVQTVNEKRALYTTSLRSAGRHGYSPNVTDAIEILIRFKAGITFPLLDSGKCFGAMFYIKNRRHDFAAEKPILKAFTEDTAAAVVNARRFLTLAKTIKEIRGMKNSRNCGNPGFPVVEKAPGMENPDDLRSEDAG